MTPQSCVRVLPVRPAGDDRALGAEQHEEDTVALDFVIWHGALY